MGEPIGTEATRVFAPPPPTDIPMTTWTPPITGAPAPTATFQPAFTSLFPGADDKDQDNNDNEPDTRDPFSSTECGQ